MPSTRLPLRLEPDVADETAIVATGASSARADSVTQIAQRTTRSFKVLHCALANPAYRGTASSPCRQDPGLRDIVLCEPIGELHDRDVRLVLAESSPLVGSRLTRYRLIGR